MNAREQPAFAPLLRRQRPRLARRLRLRAARACAPPAPNRPRMAKPSASSLPKAMLILDAGSASDAAMADAVTGPKPSSRPRTISTNDSSDTGLEQGAPFGRHPQRGAFAIARTGPTRALQRERIHQGRPRGIAAAFVFGQEGQP